MRQLDDFFGLSLRGASIAEKEVLKYARERESEYLAEFIAFGADHSGRSERELNSKMRELRMLLGLDFQLQASRYIVAIIQQQVARKAEVPPIPGQIACLAIEGSEELWQLDGNITMQAHRSQNPKLIVAQLEKHTEKLGNVVSEIQSDGCFGRPWVLCAMSFARGFFEHIADYHSSTDESRQPLLADFVDMVRYHCSFESYMEYLSYAKWWTSSLLARHMKQEVESGKPNWDRYGGLKGKMRKFLHLREIARGDGEVLSGGQSSNWRLFNGLQQLKRNFLPVSEEFVVASLQKHRAAMDRPPGAMDHGEMLKIELIDPLLALEAYERGDTLKLSSAKIEQVPSSESTNLSMMEMRLRMVLEGLSFRDLKTFQPSSNACYESGRSKFGANGFLIPSRSFTDRTRSDLIAMSYHPHVGVVEVRGIPPIAVSELANRCLSKVFFSMKEPPVHTSSYRYVDATELGNAVYDDPDLYKWIFKIPLCDRDFAVYPLRCKVAAVKEPGKVRTVTAGEADAYSVATAFQQQMHGWLRTRPGFELIGAPVEKWFLQQLDRKASRAGCHLGQNDGGEQTFWLSADFSAATDMINKKLTMLCHNLIMEKVEESSFVTYTKLKETDEADVGTIRCMMRATPLHCSSQVRRVLDACIDSHLVQYPGSPQFKEENGLEDVLQKNGQLMGSPISFPILCLVNFVVAWHALWPELKYEDVPILVNGDDLLTRCTETKYRQWEQAIKNAGLVKSVGKNFLHRRYLYINSQPWRASGREDGGTEFEYCPFYNTGLMFGQSKVSKTRFNAAGRKHMPVYALQPEAVRGALNVDRAIHRFEQVHAEEIDNACGAGWSAGKLHGRLFDPYLPVCFYGLGMTAPNGYQYGVRARQIAYLIWNTAKAFSGVAGFAEAGSASKLTTWTSGQQACASAVMATGEVMSPPVVQRSGGAWLQLRKDDLTSEDRGMSIFAMIDQNSDSKFNDQRVTFSTVSSVAARIREFFDRNVGADPLLVPKLGIKECEEGFRFVSAPSAVDWTSWVGIDPRSNMFRELRQEGVQQNGYFFHRMQTTHEPVALSVCPVRVIERSTTVWDQWNEKISAFRLQRRERQEQAQKRHVGKLRFDSAPDEELAERDFRAQMAVQAMDFAWNAPVRHGHFMQTQVPVYELGVSRNGSSETNAQRVWTALYDSAHGTSFSVSLPDLPRPDFPEISRNRLPANPDSPSEGIFSRERIVTVVEPAVRAPTVVMVNGRRTFLAAV
jgi:hypothetical protein